MTFFICWHVLEYLKIQIIPKLQVSFPVAMLSQEEKKILVGIARKSLDSYVRSSRILSFDGENYPDSLEAKAGVFVTLRKNGKLRGCMGRFKAADPLYITVRDMAISAATRDSRFNDVTADELKEILLEISVLSDHVRISDISEIELGKHGIYIKQGLNSGTFLPDVANSTGWKLEEFLGHCARDKAHIGWNGWKKAEIYTYETITIREGEI
jgi:AmmeMemoRadiSam system protein A